MEKTTHEHPQQNESLVLDNRKKLTLEGIIEINSSSETQICVKLKDTLLTILGQEMHITRLDIGTGILEVEGLVNLIKYGKTEGFLKRIFK